MLPSLRLNFSRTVKPVQSDSLGTVVVPMLALAISINYVDRGSLAITAPLIRDQLHFSSTQIGILLPSFFWTYVPPQILAGWPSYRISPCRILAGPRAAGKWMGIQNSLANCAGIIAPVVTGTIADRTGNYAPAFFIAAGVAVIGILGWGLVVRKVEATDWAAI